MKNIFLGNLKRVDSNPLIIGIILFILIRLIIWSQFNFSAYLFSGDSGYYYDVALNILNLGEHVHSSGSHSYRAPLYPYFIYGLLQLKIEINSINIYLIQSLLLLLTYIVTFLIIKHSNQKVAKIVFLLLCLAPFDAVYNGRVLAENLLAPLVLLSFILLLYFHKRGLYGYLLPGVLLGFLTLTKDVFLLLPFFIMAFMLIKKSKLKYIALFFLSYCCVISPWIVRNATLPSDNFVGISQGIFWTNIWSGAWLRDDTSLSSAIKQGFIENEQINLFELKIKNKEFEQDFFRQEAINNFKNKPIQILSNWVYRIPKMWIGTRTDLFKMKFETKSMSWFISKLSFFSLNFIIIFLLIPLLFLGILRKDRGSFLVAVFTLYLLLIYMPFYNIETRYSQPVLGIIVLYFGLSILSIKDFLKYFVLLFRKK